MSQKRIATFYGVGVGPGDPELITRKAERILREVDWIFVPTASRSETSFARRIVEPLGLPEGKFRHVSLSMSRDRTEVLNAYRRAAAEIVEELRQGKSVAWITEGDPLFYSTFLHVNEAMCRYAEVRVEIIPGITSASAAAARIGLPSASLDDRVAFVPAGYGIQHLPALLGEFATVFLFKVHSVFDELTAVLAAIPGVRAFYLEHVGTSAERVVTDFESLRGQTLPYFSQVILRRENPE